MSSFQALMALSASQTKEAQSAVQVALQDRQRKEAARRKEQEQRERKDRERECVLRLKHFEEEKKEQDRLKREEERRKAMEAALQRREDEQRNALLYGPKKANKWPASTTGAKEAVRKSRLPRERDDDDGDPPAGSFLTREELRQRKQEVEMKRLYTSSKRSMPSSGSYSRAGKRLPGGAVDITTTARAVDAGNFKSVKDRLAAEPITLTKLNVVKRDTRTIDEIVQDRAKAKVLDGDKAREFSDWFGTSKKKEPAKKASPTAPAVASASAVTSGANTPVSQRGTPGPAGASNGAIATKRASVQSTTKSSTSTSSKPRMSTSSSSTMSSKSYMSSSQPSNKTSAVNGKSSKSSSAALSSSQPNPKAHSSMLKKRPRSESLSESPPPKRRTSAHDSDSDDEAPANIGSMIWGIFGRNRDSYVGIDVFSDDDDMEADASILAKEEAMSSRIAAREEQIALEAERRHEEEKRRKKKEREARAQASR
ncbi:hypothetical protein AX17_006529 [Amanita inopinata Kibby_2008]|nr:hypothetical protein AX17_006529 [Amanita inopinata Kibby_2008]